MAATADTPDGTDSFQDEQGNHNNQVEEDHDEDGSTSSLEGSSVGNSNSASRNTSSHPDGTNSGSGSSNEDSGARGIAKEETAAVFRLRVVVILVLIVTAAVVSAVVLNITRDGENDSLETQYEGAAYAVQTAFRETMEDLSIISALAVVEVDDSTETGFPFQTLHSFNQRAANARSMSGALAISYCPIVTIEDREQWEQYVNDPAHNQWMSQAWQYQEQLGLNGFEDNLTHIETSYISPEATKPGFHINVIPDSSNQTVDPIKTFDSQGQAQVALQDGPYLPIWQTSPLLQKRIVNQNILSKDAIAAKFATAVIDTKQAMLGSFIYAPFGQPSHSNPSTSMFATYLSIAEGNYSHYLGDPLSYFYVPIFDPLLTDPDTPTQHDHFDDQGHRKNPRTVVAVIEALIEWRQYFRHILKDSIPPLVVVLQNQCGIIPGQIQHYTFELQGQEAFIRGEGDLHDSNLDSWMRQAEFNSHHVLRDGTVHGVHFDLRQGCKYSIQIYPTQLFINTYSTDAPLAITFAIAVVFIFTICLFILYDRLVEQRQTIVLRQAQHTTAIVSSLFPKNVRDRLLATAEKRGSQSVSSVFSGNKTRLKGFLDDGDSIGGANNDVNAAPIADLFPECTVFFADIAGFTAWSSTREPEQVFVLLQTVYQKFDLLAKRRKVFKVETIGDSYMAVTGLPEPMVNHAVTMVRFAWDCRTEFMKVTKALEVTLGPDTTDLAMRFGLHSGPVTAGVLRGDRARFQLFGDTVNTASRMESTGESDRVQISEATAAFIRKAGKEAWLVKRKDPVHAKGKGVVVTYWANPKGTRSSTSGSVSSSGNGSDAMSDAGSNVAPNPSQPSLKTKKVNQRLVDWMTDLLLDHAKKMMYARRGIKDKPSEKSPTYFPPEGQTCLDEVKEEIEMPSFDAKNADTQGDYRNVKVHTRVVASLRAYVLRIAENYRDNPFHNFEHACHVTMSVNKLLKRIVAPELSAEELQRLQDKDDMAAAAHLHDYTHGINSDPLLALAITISALIHDVDHRGVANTRLIEEQPEMAAKYQEKSVAEQNSLDISWAILMEDSFAELRRVLFPSAEELLRFRQLLVNVVLATDIMDKELNGLRKRRWERAFSEDGNLERGNDSNLRATIVIEHIIQASDVSHTMQHWHVYRKWNQRLFEEVYKAYLDGRMEKDPSEGWYKGEIGFFDFYIIPLAKKLKECRIFGVSSDEYLSYAEQNRTEWELKGQQIVAEMLEKLKSGGKREDN